jgi:hypothetical protein
MHAMHYRLTAHFGSLRTTLALLALLAAVPPPRYAVLYDDAVLVAPGKMRTLDIELPGEAARVICSYQVLDGGAGVRAALLERDQMLRWHGGESHAVLASTPFATRGAFSHRVRLKGRYVLALDNRMEGRGPAKVHLLVRLVRVPETGGPVHPADPLRAQILVWGSLAVFGLITFWAGDRLRRGYLRRQH